MDLNGDKHKDIIAVANSRKELLLSLFNPETYKFDTQFRLNPECSDIQAVDVGRSTHTFRLFVTC